MATGSLAGGVCYENVSLATDSYFAGLSPVSYYTSAGDLITTSYVQVSGVWNAQQTDLSAAGAFSIIYTVAAPVPSFAPCYAPSESFADGVTIGWALALVFGVVFFARITGGIFKNV